MIAQAVKKPECKPDKKCPTKENCCPDTGCYDLSQEEVWKVLVEVDRAINGYTKILVKNVQWGSPKIPITDNDFLLLSNTRKVLRRYLDQVKCNVKPCTRSSFIQAVLEKAKSIAQKVGCKEKTMPFESGELTDEALTSNCIPYERWERALHISIPSLQFDIKGEECKLAAYEVRSNLDSIEEAPKLLYALDVARKAICKLKIEELEVVAVKRCNLEYEKLIKVHPSCGVSFEKYVEWRNCGLDYRTIAKIEECGTGVVAEAVPRLLNEIETFPKT